MVLMQDNEHVMRKIFLRVILVVLLHSFEEI